MISELLRFEGYMRGHKVILKSLIRGRKYEIRYISAPQPVKGKEDGYCYIYIDGYPVDGYVEADVYDENKKLYERFCSTRQEQYSSKRKDQSGRARSRYGSGYKDDRRNGK